MKHCFTLFTGLLLALGACLPALAQESYFNVPESDVAEKNKFTVQQQFNIQDFYRSLTTIDYGLGKDWEVGANLLNLDYYPKSRSFQRNDSSTVSAYAPLLLLNSQKIFKLGNHFHIGLGGQAGLNLTPDKGQQQFVHYVYANLNKSFLDDHYKITAGLYNGHVRYLGGDQVVGFQAGFDAGIFYQKLHILGDWTSGQHDVGQLVLGLEIYLSKSLPLALGWQRSNQDGSSGLIVQLTYSPE